MTTQTLVFDFPLTGQAANLTVTAYPATGGAAIQSGVACTEGEPCQYSAAFTALGAGLTRFVGTLSGLAGAWIGYRECPGGTCTMYPASDAQIDADVLAMAAEIGAIYAKLPTNSIADETLVIAATNSILTAVGNCLQASGYTAPANASITTILTDVAAILSAQSAQATAASLAIDTSAIISAIESLESPLTAVQTAQAVLNAASATYNTPATIGGLINASGGGNITVSVVVPSAVAQASQSPGKLVGIRGDTFSETITLGNITSRLKLWLTVKQNTSQPDSAALLQFTETGGLLVVNGSATGFTSNQGSLVVTDAAAGTVQITIAAAIMTNLPPGTYVWDAQWLSSSGVDVTPTGGTFIITSDVTRAIS